MVTPEDKWFALSLKAVEQLDLADQNWGSLDNNTQELAALWKLEADMNNGGFIQFFCNWGHECYEIAIRGLSEIGALDALQIITSEFSIIDAVYQKSKSSIVEYWDIPKYVSSEDFLKLDKLDESFWEYPDNIADLGLKYYTG